MRSHSTPLLLAALLLLGSAVQAANEYSLQAPVLGYVFDPEAGTLHRVDGIPGASAVGDALPLDLVIAQAAVSPSQDYAVVSDVEGRAWIVNLSVSPVSAVLLEGALAGAEGAMISPTGARAALYSAAEGEVQWLSDPAGSPAVGATADLPEGAGSWTAFAISDRGVILAAAAQSNGGSLYALRAGTDFQRIAALSRASDLAFFTRSNDAVVADAGASEVLMIRDVVGSRQSSVIASANDNVHNPFGVEVTADGRYVAVAVPGGIASVPVFGGAPALMDCACAPTSLVPLAGGNVFQLTADIGSPMQIVEVGADSRMLFIPALPALAPAGVATE